MNRRRAATATGAVGEGQAARLPSPRRALARLRAVRNVYGNDAEREKQALLGQLADMQLTRWAEVNALHDDLLFLWAFPGSRATRALARRMLATFAARVRELPRAQRERGDDSGVAGSITRHVYPFPLARWLARTMPGDVEVDWRGFAEPWRLDGFVGLLLRDPERESFDTGEFPTRDWVRLARQVEAPTDLGWMMAAGTTTRALQGPLEAAWDGAEAPLEWRLRGSRWSATRNVLAGTPLVVRSGLRRPHRDIVAAIAQPLSSIERLSRRRAQGVVAVARAALAARCREVNAMTYPNLDEIYWCDLGEGTALAVLGIAPARRLTLETNTGYVLFSNGVPIGYGGVTPLFRQANTGINIFDPYRGSEAAFLWPQMLRAFRTLFACTRFVVNAYQFGARNAEAVKSGAFWFYYRLGFRPAAAPARAVAAREAARMAADRTYRCGAGILKALLAGDLTLELPASHAADHVDEALLPQVGALAARQLARQPDRTRYAAHRRVTQRVAHDLEVRDLARWSAPERRGFAHLAPVVAALHDLSEWTPAERDALVTMMRAKGALQERDFALAAHDAPRFFRDLVAILQNPD